MSAIFLIINNIAIIIVMVMTCINLHMMNTYECGKDKIEFVGKDADRDVILQILYVVFGFMFWIYFWRALYKKSMGSGNTNTTVLFSGIILSIGSVILIMGSQRYKEIAQGCTTVDYSDSIEQANKFFIGMIVLLVLEALLLIGTFRNKK